MIFYVLLLNLICSVLSASIGGKREKYPSGDNRDQAAALQFLQDYNDQVQKLQNKASIARWNLDNNLTGADESEMLQAIKVYEDFEKEAWENATSFAWKEFKDTNQTAYRMFKKLPFPGIGALSEEKFKELQKLHDDMEDILKTAKCADEMTDEKCESSFEPELQEICIRSREYKELTYYWCEWRNGTGKTMKDKFIRYVELSNEAAELNGFSDMGEMWRDAYESEEFEEDLEKLWLTLKPFYIQLHAYVRQKLRKQYPFSGIKADGPIPAHLLGDMWGENWSEIFDIVSPYPGKEYTDVSEAMKEKNMTPLDMFKISEEFFTSLGLIKMTPEFWHYSIFEMETDCDFPPEAFDFHDGKDVRVKMCTEVDMEDLMAIHHEMGHIEYALQYRKQPAIFQNSANPGFHEAVGEAIALSVRTPEHLKKIGLIEEVVDEKGNEKKF